MNYKLIHVQDYAPFVGEETIERILSKAESLRGFHVSNINSTYYGGGVAELLSSMTLLMNGLGIKTGWRVIQGSPDFFGVTKKMHNALQGMGFKFTTIKKQIYENVIYENSIRNHLDHDLIVVTRPAAAAPHLPLQEESPLGLALPYRSVQSEPGPLELFASLH